LGLSSGHIPLLEPKIGFSVRSFRPSALNRNRSLLVEDITFRFLPHMNTSDFPLYRDVPLTRSSVPLRASFTVGMYCVASFFPQFGAPLLSLFPLATEGVSSLPGGPRRIPRSAGTPAAMTLLAFQRGSFFSFVPRLRSPMLTLR